MKSLFLLAIIASLAACGTPSAPAAPPPRDAHPADAISDAGVDARQKFAFGGPISPQGGTLTGISGQTGGGLQGGGTSGAVTMSLLRTCSNNQVLQWNNGASAWQCGTSGGTCATEPALTGDITSAGGTCTTTFRTGAADSVLGRPANSSGAIVDIAATTNGQVLGMSGGVVGFTDSYMIGPFGSGVDGNVTINAGTTTLARNMYYDTLTLAQNAVLDVHGWQVYAKSGIVCPASGTATITFVTNAGAAGTNAAGGAGAASVVSSTNFVGGTCNQTCGVGGFGAGGGGGSPACAPNWPSYYSTGAVGQPGVGATGCAGTTTGGAASTVTPIAASNGGWDDPIAFGQFGGRLPRSTVVTFGGTCGGGGGGGTSCGGGGGGQGGGIVVVSAWKFTNAANCIISAPGGNGGDACQTCANNCSGGGGGGGGVVDLVVGVGSFPGSVTATGGSGGAARNAGTGGATCKGSDGKVMQARWGLTP